MARLQPLPVKFEEGAGVERLNGTGKVVAFVGWRAFSGHWLVPGTA